MAAWFQDPSSEEISGVYSLLWLGRKDSNLRMRDSKSRALPLGDAPTLKSEGLKFNAAR